MTTNPQEKKTLEDLLFERVQKFASERKETVMKEETVRVIDYGPGGIENMWMGSDSYEVQQVPEIVTHIDKHPVSLRRIFSDLDAAREQESIAAYNVLQRMKTYEKSANERDCVCAALYFEAMKDYVRERVLEDGMLRWLRETGERARKERLPSLTPKT